MRIVELPLWKERLCRYTDKSKIWLRHETWLIFRDDVTLPNRTTFSSSPDRLLHSQRRDRYVEMWCGVSFDIKLIFPSGFKDLVKNPIHFYGKTAHAALKVRQFSGKACPVVCEWMKAGADCRAASEAPALSLQRGERARPRTARSHDPRLNK